MPEHKVQRRKSIRFFNDLEMRAVWDNNHYEWWVSVLEIFVAINEQDDYQKTRNHWIFLRIKLKKEINDVSFSQLDDLFLNTLNKLKGNNNVQ